MVQNLVLVAIGGAIGAVLRYAVALALPAHSASTWPWATLLVNITGCLAIGVVMGLALGSAPVGAGDLGPTGVAPAISPAMGLFLATGILGGFTTFSAFGFETLRMVQAGHVGSAIAYALGSVVLGVLAVGGGWAIAR